MTQQSNPQSKDIQPIVYIRPVEVADLPDEMRAQVSDVDTVYAIGNEEGQQLALVKDRKLAFHVARQNDMQPVSVH